MVTVMFFEKLMKLLKTNGISRNTLSCDLGFGKNQIKYWENNKNIPNGEIVLQIADYFGVSTDYLLRNEQKSASMVLPPEEIELVMAYRSKDMKTKEAIKTILGVESVPKKPKAGAYEIAAFGGDNTVVEDDENIDIT